VALTDRIRRMNSTVIERYGVDIQIDYGTTIRGLYNAPGTVTTVLDGSLIQTDPECIIATADVERLGIKSGKSGTAIIIDRAEFRILKILPDGAGLSTLTLAKL